MPFKVIIPSRNPSNLIACVTSILKNEPQLESEDIIVIDDGARVQAEPQLPKLSWIEGRRPFVFARNVNLGLTAAKSDVILMNDDATLERDHGFSDLHRLGAHWGLASPSVLGAVGNHNQRYKPGSVLVRKEVRKESRMLCFVCVLIPFATQQRVGFLDERFTAYGWEDNDYSKRVLDVGLEMAVLECCVVKHGFLPSTFRSGKSHSELGAMGDGGMRIFKQKWGHA